MFQLLLLLTVVLVVFVLKQTLFKRSRCRGNIPMAGKTVIITGEGVLGREGPGTIYPFVSHHLVPERGHGGKVTSLSGFRKKKLVILKIQE